MGNFRTVWSDQYGPTVQCCGCGGYVHSYADVINHRCGEVLSVPDLDLKRDEVHDATESGTADGGG